MTCLPSSGCEAASAWNTQTIITSDTGCSRDARGMPIDGRLYVHGIRRSKDAYDWSRYNFERAEAQVTNRSQRKWLLYARNRTQREVAEISASEAWRNPTAGRLVSDTDLEPWVAMQTELLLNNHKFTAMLETVLSGYEGGFLRAIVTHNPIEEHTRAFLQLEQRQVYSSTR